MADEEEKKTCVCGASLKKGEDLCKDCARPPWDEGV